MKKILALFSLTLSALHTQAQWLQVYSDPSMGAMQTVALNKDTVFVSRNWDQLLKTTNGGASWDTITFQNAQNYRVHFIDQQHGFVAGSAPFISGPTFFKTDDCGITWQPMNFSAGAPNFTTDVHFLDEDTGFVSDGLVAFKTTDGGANFLPLTIDSGDMKINDLHFISRSTGFAGVLYAPPGGGFNYTENRIYKTTDQGASWFLVHSDTSMGKISFVFAGITEIFFVNDSFGMATGGEGKILRTTDAGNSWTDVSTPFFSFDISDVQFLTEQKGYICHAGKMYYTADGMQNWRTLQDSTFDYYSVDMLDENFGYAAGHGIFKTTNGGGITSVSMPAKRALSISVYPNPATEHVMLQYENLHIYDLMLMDISGKMLRRFSAAAKALDISGIPQGTYLLMIKADEGSRVERLLIR